MFYADAGEKKERGSLYKIMSIEGCLHLRVSKNNSGENQIIFVIPGKAIKKAVSRNKIRRRAREILRKKKGDIKTGNNLAFIFKKGAEGRSYKELEEEISQVLKEKRLAK